MEATAASSARSYLFVPADRPDRLAKALITAADIVVVDLEDAVAVDSKLRARDALASAAFPRERVMVRINGSTTEWCSPDIDAMKTLGVTAVMLPKAEDAAEIAGVAARLGPAVAIIALVETAAGVWNALEIARAPQVARLAFGSIDFALDANTSLDDTALLYARSRLVLASRVARLPQPIDGVTTAIDKPFVLEADARAGHPLGYGAKLCIHPKQVELVNRVYTPSDEEVAWALAVMAAAESSSGAAAQLSGQMIDLPIIKRAERIARLAGRSAGG